MFESNYVDIHGFSRGKENSPKIGTGKSTTGGEKDERSVCSYAHAICLGSRPLNTSLVENTSIRLPCPVPHQPPYPAAAMLPPMQSQGYNLAPSHSHAHQLPPLSRIVQQVCITPASSSQAQSASIQQHQHQAQADSCVMCGCILIQVGWVCNLPKP